MRARCSPLVLSLALAGCGSTPAPIDGGTDAPVLAPDVPPVPFELTSTAYGEGGTVPLRHECGPPLVTDGPGDNVSPALAWTEGPAGTMSYAIVMRDRDAGNLVHWVVYDLPASTRSLPEDLPQGYALADPAGAHQAELQGTGYYGYFGPCSPASINTYEIAVHALGTATLPGVSMSSTEDELAAAIEAASLGSALLRGES